MKTIFLLGFALIAVLTLSTPAYAQVHLSLTPDIRTGLPGTTISFTGLVENSGPDTVFFAGAESSVSGTGLSVQSDPFTFGGPVMLAPGDSWTGTLFDVILSPDVEILRDYQGTFTINGGADEFSQDMLATTQFTVRVTESNAPEPSSVALILPMLVLTGGIGLLMRHRLIHIIRRRV